MRVALVGNQNSGKTTLFNLLTGTNQKVGNWPGVTIERKSGTIKGTNFEIVDLPGVYSLSPYTAEEEVSRHFAVEENPDIIINIIDATTIERSLYLTTQLLELDSDVLLALNMEDLLEKKGIKIDPEALSRQLGVTVVVISALKETGIDELIDHIKKRDILKNRHQKIYSDIVEHEIDEITRIVNVEDRRFVAVKLLERDIMFAKYHSVEIEKSITKLEEYYGTDTEEIIASLRYDYIERVKKESVRIATKKISITDHLDRVFLNKWAAIPIFLVIMFLVYFLSVGLVGSSTVDLIGEVVDAFSGIVNNWLVSLGASNWIVSLVCDGVIAGVGAMFSFVPQLIIMFLCISLLETTGYMSRITFFLDRVFKKFGLSGKSLIPFIVGSGCSVPGIMTSRIVEDETEKRMTIMLTPFIPCSAKLPIIIVFTSYFFKDQTGLVAFSLYALAVAIILISAFIMKKFFFKGQPSAFISELPEYKLPSIKYIARDVFDKVWAFIKRAGSIIFICSVIIWVLLSFTWTFQYTSGDSHQIEEVNLSDVAKAHNIADYDSVLAQIVDGKVQVSYRQDEAEEAIYSDWIDVLDASKLISKISETELNDQKELHVHYEDDMLNWSYTYGIDNSILAGIGNGLAWLFYPIVGEWSWAATVSAIQGLVAKEQVVGSMAVIAGYDAETSTGSLIFRESGIFGSFNQISAYAFMAFNLFSAPCFGAIAAMRKELGSFKKTMIAIGFQTGLAFVLSYLIFGLGTLVGTIL